MCFSLRSFMNRCLGLSSPTRSIRIRVPLLGSRSMLCGRASGPAPNIARSLVDDSVMVASGSAGFQVLGRTQIDDGHIVIAVLTAAPAGSLWCGIDVEAGTVLLYGPGAEHTAISPEGLEYLVASIETRTIEETAEMLGMTVALPQRGEVRVLSPPPRGAGSPRRDRCRRRRRRRSWLCGCPTRCRRRSVD